MIAPNSIEVETDHLAGVTYHPGALSTHVRDVTDWLRRPDVGRAVPPDLDFDIDALTAGAEALAAGAPLVVDVPEVTMGIPTYPALCLADSEAACEISVRSGITLPAAGVQLAAARVADDAVWVVGGAPSALWELLRLAEGGVLRPALVIGFPGGLVDAVEAKASLRHSGLPSVSNLGSRGGVLAAATLVNALVCGVDCPVSW